MITNSSDGADFLQGLICSIFSKENTGLSLGKGSFRSMKKSSSFLSIFSCKGHEFES